MRKFLLIRTDRIGDVVLTTPVIQTLRSYFPQSHVSFMVHPSTKDILDGNPYLNEIIAYDKESKHKGILKTMLFALFLRRKKFDAVIIFNPKKSSHWISFLAGIPIRIGYHRKHGFLLTHRMEDKKKEGKISEAFYNERLLSFLHIPASYSRKLYFPLKLQAKQSVYSFLKANHIQRPFVVINISSGCPSKTWPLQNFALLCDLIDKRLKLTIITIGKKEECEHVKHLCKAPLVSIAESFTLSQLGALFKEAQLHISSDTGPMHIASAVGTPVISIFGRTLPGLGPLRWQPLKGNNTILQKNIGCHPCLADRCKIEFDCLKATKVEEVFRATERYTKLSSH